MIRWQWESVGIVRGVVTENDIVGRIRQDAKLAELLWRRWEFSLERAGDRRGEPRVSAGVALECVAGDWTGGSFFLCGAPTETRPVLYASSEGQAGLIGNSLGEALEIMIGLPSWHDCLGFSGGGDLAVMRATADHLLRDELADRPEVGVHRVEAATALSLEVVSVPVLLSRLHEAVRRTEPEYAFSDETGEYESLFGPWLPSRNPRWR